MSLENYIKNYSEQELKRKDLLLDDSYGDITRGEKMTNRSIADFEKPSDSVSLAKLNNAPFTIVAVEPSDYKDGNEVNPGVKITTKEAFTIDGEKYTKFHSTRHAIVKKLLDPSVLEALAKGDTIGPVKTEKQKAKTKGVPDYYVLIPA